MNVFQLHIQENLKGKNSVVEVLRLLNSIHDILADLQAQNLMSVKVKSLIEEKRRDGYNGDSDKVNCLSKLCAG